MTEQELKLNTNKYQNTVATIQEDVLSQRIKIEQLEKENAELKAKLNHCCLEDNNDCLAKDKWEIAQKENKELKAQIEKMKNMQNCKHNWESKGQCVLKNGGYCICDKWELSE